jgi:hypothetical protein
MSTTRRHDVATVARTGADVGMKEGALASWAGFVQRARSEAAACWRPCPLCLFLKNSFSKKSLNAKFETIAKHFRIWGKKKKYSP